MIPIDKIIKLFFAEFSKIKEIENDFLFEIELSSSSIVIPDAENLSNLLTLIPQRDNLLLTIRIGESSASFYSLQNNIVSFLEELSTVVAHRDDETISLSITITKNNSLGVISIYDFTIFRCTLESLSITQVLHIFKRAIGNLQSVIFECPSIPNNFQTQTIFFTSKAQSIIISDNNRLTRIDKLKQVAHFSELSTCPFLPEDFKIIGSKSGTSIDDLLERLSFLYSIIYLFDITSISDNTLNYKINGYKSIAGSSDIKNSIPQEEYFIIYSWVFNGGNLIDKIGLARNIISLHFEIAGMLLLKGNAFQSIQSSYKVYEKQNIKQYIEIRNKISDQLLEYGNRANKIIETFASGFQKSALALITFYVSAFILRVLGSGNFLNVFTPDATVLSIAFLGGSLLYFFVSRWEVKEQRKRFINSYTNMKQRYTDLLDEADIKKILNNDKEFNEDLGFIDQKLKVYSWMWGGILTILFLATLVLFLLYGLHKLLNLIQILFMINFF